MTKRLEELFNLDDKDAVKKKKVKDENEEIKSADAAYRAAKKITRSLPAIAELDSIDDRELDDLAKKAETAYDDLMDLGMNVEVRYSGRIFEVASSMMKNAIDAKTAKIDKKLKAVDLQLKKLKIESDHKSKDDDGTIAGEGYVIADRNDLLKKLSKKD